MVVRSGVGGGRRNVWQVRKREAEVVTSSSGCTARGAALKLGAGGGLGDVGIAATTSSGLARYRQKNYVVRK